MSTSYIAYLQKKMKKKQKILRKLTKLYGFTHPVVVAYSQELDPLVVLSCAIFLLDSGEIRIRKNRIQISIHISLLFYHIFS
ncbi:Spo0E family sporulation regulatory protein-aspartic acid phosphatase [Bacillus thuringiensis]|uniref:Spo0E family sporulation regulatory protein-aspartic acid phosphatase n=1 Tax=Bacillus thuringiensis TaxID=1428 RepID=UPI001EEE725E|nr:Spo0E family sporulation regulatory protein-aspartic acid phosphatase [Bacillus thuringiensis]